VDGYRHVTGSRSHGCLHLIDLAGSERVGKSEASGACADDMGVNWDRWTDG